MYRFSWYSGNTGFSGYGAWFENEECVKEMVAEAEEKNGHMIHHWVESDAPLSRVISILKRRVVAPLTFLLKSIKVFLSYFLPKV